MDRAKVIFGNEIREKDYQKAVKKQAGFVRKYGDDRGVQYGVSVQDAPVITEYFGAQNLVSGTDMAPELGENAVRALEGRKAVLLANHGVIALGASLAGAHTIVAEVENLAGQYLDLLASGLEPAILDEAEMERVSARFAGYGKVG